MVGKRGQTLCVLVGIYQRFGCIWLSICSVLYAYFMRTWLWVLKCFYINSGFWNTWQLEMWHCLIVVKLCLNLC